MISPFVISYNLFGTSPKYLVGAVRNVELSKQFYPDWRCRFYCREDVPGEVIDKLRSLGAECLHLKARWFGEEIFWRAQAADDPHVKRVMIRDADSRFTFREQLAVFAWVRSGKLFHVMRDHPAHSAWPIPGGLWGARRGAVPGIYELAEFWRRTDPVYEKKKAANTWYNLDQIFLARMVWPLVRSIALQHDEFSRSAWGGQPWPTPVGADGNFVGEVFDEHDQPRLVDRTSRHHEKNSR
jgi:hypothetical protein